MASSSRQPERRVRSLSMTLGGSLGEKLVILKAGLDLTDPLAKVLHG